MAQPLLLHSLTEFRVLIRACLEAAGAATILEIGSESGSFTRELLDFATERDGALTCVEPQPTLELERLASEHEAFRLIRGRSPDALEGLPACDAYVIDGDHNYWTVASELAHLHKRALGEGRPALAVLHDVSWPCARRDQYYAPDALPAHALHPHSWDHGSVPGEDAAIRGGLRGSGSFSVALQAGGARNGVLTAVEDFVGEHADYRFAHIPVVFGVGVLYPASAPYADALAALLGPFDGNPLLEAIERNRIDLYLRVIELQDSVSDLGLQQGRLLGEYDRSLTAAETEAAELRARLAAREQGDRDRGSA